MNILLVDDDSFLRDMYATKFGQDGHTVEVAKTAESAIQQLQSNTFDAVLLDMIMPGMTGVDLLKRIKEDNLGGDPVCIVLSNQSHNDEIEAAMKAGAKGYIIKAELIPSQVLDKVKEIVNK